MAPQAPPPASPPAQDPERSYDDNFEVESDEDLEGAEIIADEEEEDYSAVVVRVM